MTRTRYGHLFVLAQSVLLFYSLFDGLNGWTQIKQETAVTRIIGGGLFLVGIAWMLLAFVALGKSLTPNPVPKRTGKLQTKGIYGISRHPVYLGLFLSLLGWAIFWGSVGSLCCFILLVPLLRRKALFEESLLIEKYGEAYLDYSRKVPRIFPDFSRA